MEEKITVKDIFNRLVNLLEEGKGFWDMDIETESGEKVKGVRLVAIKPEGEVLTCLFG